MAITILMVGKTQKGFIDEGFNEYYNRLKFYTKLELTVVELPKKFANSPIEIQKNEEAKLLRQKINTSEKSKIMLLDERGEEFTSDDFASWMQKSFNIFNDLTFVIGGPYGFSSEMKSAYTKMALSKMTFSHQMVRFVFIEQLYRAFTIIKGENYHH